MFRKGRNGKEGMSKGKKSIKKSERNNPVRKSIRIRKTKDGRA